MRYAQGGGLTAEGRRRREQVRLEAAERFDQQVPAAVIAVELRVSDRSVCRWRQAWRAGGEAGLASRGPAARCRLNEQQLAALDLTLEAGPLAAGWEDQRWTLGRIRDLVARKFQVQYTIPGIWYLLHRRGWIERNDGAAPGIGPRSGRAVPVGPYGDTRLVVIREVEPIASRGGAKRKAKRNRAVLCRCECGTMVTVRLSNLARTRSCGCWRREVNANRARRRPDKTAQPADSG
jgi:transposase